MIETLGQLEVAPDVMQSDNAKVFRSKAVKEFWEDRGTEYRYGAARTPQHQGLVERVNRTIKTALFRWIHAHWNEDPSLWVYEVPRIFTAYNSTVPSTIHFHRP